LWQASTPANNGAMVSGDEVPKKLKQNVNIVHILTLLVAFQYGSTHYISPLKWETWPWATASVRRSKGEPTRLPATATVPLVILAGAFVAGSRLWRVSCFPPRCSQCPAICKSGGTRPVVPQPLSGARPLGDGVGSGETLRTHFLYKDIPDHP